MRERSECQFLTYSIIDKYFRKDENKMHINWDRLDDEKKTSHTRKLLWLFDSNGRSYTADIHGNQIKMLDYIKKMPFKGKKDAFFSPNPMKKGRGRSIEAVACITCIKLDLDTKKKGIDPLRAYFILSEMEDIPMPTAVVNSTGGLHVYWILDKFVKVSAKKLHDKIVRKLCEKLKDLNPDVSASIDISRVLRPPMSINGKRDEEVSILWLSEKLYSLDELAEAILGDNYNHSKELVTEPQLKYIKTMETVLDRVFPENYKDTMAHANKTINHYMSEYKSVLFGKTGSEPASDKQLATIFGWSETLNIPFPDKITTQKEADEWIKAHDDAYHNRPATENQMSFIKTICDKLHLDMPDDIATVREADYFIKKKKPLLNCVNITGSEDDTSNKRDMVCLHVIAATLRNFIEQNLDRNFYKRELALFFLRNTLNYVNGVEESTRIVNDLASRMTDWSYSASAEKLTYSSVKYYESGDIRVYTLETIGKWISNDGETIDLKAYYVRLKSDEERKKNNISRMKSYRKSREKMGRLPMDEEIKERRRKVHELRQEGKTIRQIPSILGVSKSTVEGDVKFLKSNPNYFDTDNVVLIECNPYILNKELCSIEKAEVEETEEDWIIGNDIESSNEELVKTKANVSKFLGRMMNNYGLCEDNYDDVLGILEDCVRTSKGQERILVQNCISYLFRKRTDVIDSFFTTLRDSDNTKSPIQRFFDSIRDKFGIEPVDFKVKVQRPSLKQITARANFLDFAETMEYCRTLRDDNTVLGMICGRFIHDYYYSRKYKDMKTTFCGKDIVLEDMRKALFCVSKQDICETANMRLTPKEAIELFFSKYYHYMV